MDPAGALSDTQQTLGAIAVAALAAGVLLVPRPRPRAVLMLLTLALTPVLLVADIWDTSQIHPLRERPALAVAAAVIGLGVVLAGAVLFDRRPAWWVIAAVAMVPFRVPIESGGESTNLLVPLYVVIGAGAVAYALAAFRGRLEEDRETPQGTHLRRPFGRLRHPSPGALEWALAGAVVLYAIQGAYASDTSKALENVVFFYVPFSLLFALLSRAEMPPSRVRMALSVLAVLALGFAAIGFVEYATRHVFLNPRVVASNQLESYFRVNSLFFDPNIYGRFLTIVMVSLVAGLLWTQKRRELVLNTVVLAVLFAALLTTLSQSSLSALLIGMAVLAAVRWNLRRTVYAAGGLVLLGVLIVVLFGSHIGVDLSNRQELSKNTSGRSELIQGGYDLWAAKPVFGFGSGSYESEFRKHQHVSADRALSASHTIPLTVAAEQGTLGFLVYLALLVAAFARLFPNAGGCVIRAGVLAAFTALVFHTFLYAAFLEDPLTWVLLGLGTALAIRRWSMGAEAAAEG
jgi:O-antigen ligase